MSKIKRQTKNWKEQHRLHAVKLKRAGWKQKDIATALDVSPMATFNADERLLLSNTYNGDARHGPRQLESTQQYPDGKRSNRQIIMQVKRRISEPEIWTGYRRDIARVWNS